MAGPTKPPKGTGKPLLGDDDLASELDAWDATFDALHGEEAAGAVSSEPVMAWPTPAPQPAQAQAAAAAAPDLEDQMTLDTPMSADGDDDASAMIEVEVEVPMQH